MLSIICPSSRLRSFFAISPFPLILPFFVPFIFLRFFILSSSCVEVPKTRQKKNTHVLGETMGIMTLALYCIYLFPGHLQIIDTVTEARQNVQLISLLLANIYLISWAPIVCQKNMSDFHSLQDLLRKVETSIYRNNNSLRNRSSIIISPYWFDAHGVHGTKD